MASRERISDEVRAAVWRSREDDLIYIELDVTSVSYED